MASDASFNQETSGLKVAETYSSRCAGKTVLITGVSPGGIGDGTARAFAHGGAATVIITGRDDTKLSTMIQSLTSAYPKTKFRPLKLDMNSLASVQKAAQEILDDSSIPVIDILVANAGMNSFQNVRAETNDGIETHFGVNHMAHFLLISSLIPKLKAAAKKSEPGETRVVVVTSGATMASPVRFHDWNYENKPVPPEEAPAWDKLSKMVGRDEPLPFEFYIAYGQSKTAGILVAHQLNRLLAKDGVYTFAVHPGFVESTGAKTVIPHLDEATLQAFGFMKTIDQGCSTTMVAGLDPGLKPENGFMLADCQVHMEMCPEWSKSDDAAEKLWKLSEDIVKEKLGQ